MTTKIIGIKEFRNRINTLWKTARKKNIRYIIMYHSTPILEARPIDEDELIFEKFADEIKEAREQFKRGEYYTQEEIMKEFGLKKK